MMFRDCAMGAILMVFGTASASCAQVAGSAIETVTVTGTAIRGSASVGANVIGIDRDAIDTSGSSTIQSLLTAIPAVTGFGNAGQGGYGALDASGTNAPTIHSLGASASNSTLVLVDSHRIPLSGLAHSLADPSTIPLIALERVEVLPDGASSIYGSDAAAGVLNFLTRKSFQGAETSVSYGAGLDYNSADFGQIVGAGWNGGTVMAAYEYTSRSRLEGAARGFVNDDQSFRGLTNFANFYCGPATVSPGTTTPVYVYPYNGAAISSGICGQARESSLLPSENRNNAILSLHQDLTDWLTVSSDLNWSSRIDNANTGRGTLTAIAFGPGSGKGSQINPFYVANPGNVSGTEVVRYDFNALLGAGAHTKSGTQAQYATIDFEAKLPADWTADLDMLAGSSTAYARSYGVVCTACADLALNGTTNAFGTASASSLPTVDNTTVLTTRPLSTANALNVWGALGSTAAGGASTSAAILSQLVDNKGVNQTGQTIDDVNLKATGSVMDLPAGPIKAAIGAEYRHTGLTQYAVADTAAGPSSTNSSILEDSLARTVYAAYAEFNVPLVAPEAGMPLVQSLNLDLSGRWDRYNDVGETENPRLAFDWQIVDGLKARGTWGTSFVAPALTSTGGAAGITTESQAGYGTAIGGQVTVPVAYTNMGPGNSTQATLITAGQIVGNAANQGVLVGGPGGASVHPETALTESLGLDIDPGRWIDALDGFQAHITYWQAKFIGAITAPLSTQAVQIPALARDLVINPSDAQIAAVFNSGRQILSVPSGPITFLQYYVQQNAFNLYANGLDFSISYRWDMGNWGDARAGFDASEKLRFDQQSGGFGGAIVNNLNRNNNATFSSLAFTGRGNLGWHLDPVSAAIFLNWTTPYYQAATSYKVPANVTVDANLTYDLPAGDANLEGTQLFVEIQNLFNQPPPPYNVALGYDTQDASPLGRLVSFGLRKTW